MDPKQVALKEKLKQDRRAANDRRKASTKKDAGRASSPPTRPVLELISGTRDGGRTRSIAPVSLSVIEGGKTQKA